MRVTVGGGDEDEDADLQKKDGVRRRESTQKKVLQFNAGLL